MTIYGLTSDGFTAARQADFLTIVRNEYETRLVALGVAEPPDWERDLFLGQTSEIMSYLLGQLSEGNMAVYDQRSVANAVGLHLDNLALIVGVTRQEATKGTVTLTCTGTDGTAILQGKVVEGGGDDGKARWVVSADAVIGTLVSGTVDVAAIAETAGVVVATATQIDTIVTAVDGWDAVTNAASADPGTARETNGELRARRQRALQAAGSTNVNAILSALLGLDEVDGAVVLDDVTGTAAVVDGISVAAYAVACVVTPDSMTLAEQAVVVQTIFEHLGGGTTTSGSDSGTVTKYDGRSHTINFSFAADTAVNLAFTLAMEPGFLAADVAGALELLVDDYFLTVFPGGTVYPTPLVCLAASLDGVANVDALLLNGAAVAVSHLASQQPIKGTFAVA